MHNSAQNLEVSEVRQVPAQREGPGNGKKQETKPFLGARHVSALLPNEIHTPGLADSQSLINSNLGGVKRLVGVSAPAEEKCSACLLSSAASAEHAVPPWFLRSATDVVVLHCC